MKFAQKQHTTVYNRVDLCVTIHKPILLGGLVLFNDKNKNYEKIRKNTNAPLKFEIRIRIFSYFLQIVVKIVIRRGEDNIFSLLILD